ncbi:hypothetical protein G7Y89_g15039 [Cudoniella acicularis]|uniref:Uncharacterized protein n=1 Tax=Cudoniella acicularis TaxID=354080 RepID=A0A8H4QUX6_9HELO|nr:hypothetical protein G7Y89_g15039 [Cudoniella acicularis]
MASKNESRRTATGCLGAQKQGNGPRKGHRKSRQGCHNCKRRKIKANFQATENFKQIAESDNYITDISISMSPQQPITLHETQIYSLTDMRLFHHYLVAAYPHLPVRNDNVWLTYITPIGHQYDYVMHALLALSASHLNKLTTSDLASTAKSHRLAAIKGLNSVLDQPVTTAEQGDAILATCYSLLMQSWYMDDGLPTFLVMTRSCDLVTRQIQQQEVGSILAQENLDSRIERMRPRLNGAPTFSVECIRSSLISLNAVQSLYLRTFEKHLWTSLQDCFISLASSPAQAYQSFLEIEKSLTGMESSELEQLMDPCRITSQLLLAHFVALQLIMRPIACRERKVHTVTMYGIRMDSWISEIRKRVKPEYQHILEWPLLISRLHSEKCLESYTLAQDREISSPTSLSASNHDRPLVGGPLSV